MPPCVSQRRAGSLGASLAASALACVAGLLAPAPVHAQAGEPALQAAATTDARAALASARERAANADFPGALEALDRAYAGDGLSRETLASLLIERALVRSALGESGAAEEDLARLVRIDPRAQLPPTVAPALAARFETLRGLIEAPRFEVDVRDGDGVVIEARAIGAGDLVREVEIETRAPGEDWTSRDGERAVVAAPPGSSLEIRARWIGPGGALIASRGEDAPIVHATPAEAPPAGDDGPLIAGLTIGAVLVAAGAAIAVAVVLEGTGGDAGTQLGAPIVTW